MKNRIYSQSGFTLIELMIVIAIIGILAAVALPNFLKARDMAKYSSCMESLSSVRVGEEMYITDNHTYTGNSDYLVMYMAATCTDPDGQGPGCRMPNGKNIVDARITNDNCRTWNIDAWNDQFIISGTARDRNTCHICVGVSGYRPDTYKDCPTFKGSFHGDCLNL